MIFNTFALLSILLLICSNINTASITISNGITAQEISSQSTLIQNACKSYFEPLEEHQKNVARKANIARFEEKSSTAQIQIETIQETEKKRDYQY